MLTDSTFIESCPLDLTQPQYKDFKRQDPFCSIDGPRNPEIFCKGSCDVFTL